MFPKLQKSLFYTYSKNVAQPYRCLLGAKQRIIREADSQEWITTPQPSFMLSWKWSCGEPIASATVRNQHL